MCAHFVCTCRSICDRIIMFVSLCMHPFLSFCVPCSVWCTVHNNNNRYFDCTFAIPRVASSASGENLPHEASLVMSTSPEEEYTHWKQTVMYLEHPIHLREGDAITGTITCAGNSKNPRDLDISIEYSYESGPNNQMIQRTQAWRMR